jgi:hypothetical protein
MNQSLLFKSKRPQSPAPGYGPAIYTHPSDVTNDPKLTTAEKRAILASWISDARTVENAPSLRQLDSGAVVEVDAIRQALVFAGRNGARPQRQLQAAPPFGPQTERHFKVAERPQRRR